MTVEKVLAENARLQDEMHALQEKLTVAQANAARMTESLALATTEAEVFRRQAGELKLRLEAIGVEGGTTVTNRVEQRYLTALNDLHHADQERLRLREALTGLSEATLRFSKKAAVTEPDAKRALEQQLRKATDVLDTAAPVSGGPPTAAALSDGTIINISEELAVVVANLGSKHGVTAGMPFQVLRENHLIGTIRIVDVREKIAGAIVENLSSEKEHIKVGDRVKIAARQ